tara:strand:+ start:1280 stop:1624 length:345 start_codon:yes stop_codon:yes gene_type:complete
MGSALGGGAADQVLGAGSAAQLTKLTVASIAGFFVLSFALYALYQSEAGESEELQRLGTDEPALLPSAVPSIPLPSQPGESAGNPLPDEKVDGSSDEGNSLQQQKIDLDSNSGK